MASMARDAWTDERLDDLRGEMTALRGAMREELHGVREEMRQMRGEIGALHRATIRLALGMISAMLIGWLTLLAAILATT